MNDAERHFYDIGYDDFFKRTFNEAIYSPWAKHYYLNGWLDARDKKKAEKTKKGKNK